MAVALSHKVEKKDLCISNFLYFLLCAVLMVTVETFCAIFFSYIGFWFQKNNVCLAVVHFLCLLIF